jgi:hypothetical protein
VIEQLRADGRRLQAQLTSADLTGATATTARLREKAAHARSLTSGPVWAVAAVLPGVRRDVQAVRAVTTSLAEVFDAARPLEDVLPRLDPQAQKASGGLVDVDALSRAAAALPAVSQAVPTVLGADGPRTHVVLLEQDAEARGTGGLVGSFAAVRADRGKLSLQEAASRTVLQTGKPIPVAGLPEGLQSLWGKDLSEWAGLNLSPHFPWTGQLVASGWAAQGRTPRVDLVVGIDEYVVAALLAGTGPVTVEGITLTSSNAPAVLSRDIYASFRDPTRIDRVTAGLAQEVFGRISSGRFSLAP